MIHFFGPLRVRNQKNATSMFKNPKLQWRTLIFNMGSQPHIHFFKLQILAHMMIFTQMTQAHYHCL